MPDDPTFCSERANVEYGIARAATLENVRERSERSAKAWGRMADRAEHMAEKRVVRDTSRTASVPKCEP